MAINHTRELWEADIDWKTPSHKLVGLAVAYHSDKRGVCRLTQGEIGSAVLLSRQRVASILDDLCELRVIARLHHGRYGVRFGLPKTDDIEVLPTPKGAEKEFARLQAIRARNQYIAWTKDGWPSLQEDGGGKDES